MKTKTLYRPVNKVELDLIQESKWKEFPPRLPEQPIFYPVTNQEYASQITIEWNIPTYKNGFVTAFDVDEAYLSKFNIEKVGLDHHTELWVPSEELDEFNANIKGPIRVIEGYSSNQNEEYIQIVDKFELSNIGKVILVKLLNSKFSIDSNCVYKLGEIQLGQIVNENVNLNTQERLITFKIIEENLSKYLKGNVKILSFD